LLQMTLLLLIPPWQCWLRSLPCQDSLPCAPAAPRGNAAIVERRCDGSQRRCAGRLQLPDRQGIVGRPVVGAPLTPRAFAAFVRADIMPASNSATAAICCSINRPVRRALRLRAEAVRLIAHRHV
jgi:hypothetical protein